MDGAALARIGVTWGFYAAVWVGANNTLKVRTVCDGSTNGEKDSGLYVYNTSGTYNASFNDNCSLSNADCFCKTCSLISVPSQTVTAAHYVRAFSVRKGDAYCAVQYKVGSGSWTYFSAFAGGQKKWIGGRLIDVGPVTRGSSGDTFTGHTTDDGASSRTAIEMLLFDTGGSEVVTAGSTSQQASHYRPVVAGDVSATDEDPHIGAPTNLRPGGTTSSSRKYHYLLLRKTSAPPDPAVHADIVTQTAITRSGGAPEQTLSLTTLPAAGSAGSGCSGFTSGLTAGRYFAELTIKAEETSGATALAPGAITLSGVGTMHRGRLNAHAFRLRVEMDIGGYYATVSSRSVNLGEFGCDETDAACFDTLLIPFEITGDYYPPVRLCVDSRNHSPDLRYSVPDNNVEIVVNRPHTEIKMATVNIMHGPGGWDVGNQGYTNEPVNLSDLFGPAGYVDEDAKGLIASDWLAPFQWDTDIYAFQELYDGAYEIAESNLQLNYGGVVTVADPTWTQLNRSLTKVDLGANFYGSGSTYANDGTIDSGLVPDTTNCNDSLCDIDAGGFYHNRASMMALGSWQTGFAHDGHFTPIAVFNAHLNCADCWLDPGTNVDVRFAELENLMNEIEEAISLRPSMFNTTGGTSATDPGNRFVIMGDLNLLQHHYGEAQWFLRALRRRFGWAVDAAQADEDAVNNHYAMHNGGEVGGNPPTGVEYDGFVPDEAMAASYTSIAAWTGMSESTATAKRQKYWWDSGVGAYEWHHAYPYWSRTYRGKTPYFEDDSDSLERYDYIILVGKGWRSDNPVAKYVLMNVFDHSSSGGGETPWAPGYGAAGEALAVDMWCSWSDTDFDVANNLSGAMHYKPRFILTTGDYAYDGGDLDSGSCALHTDHVPVGARIRVGH